MLAYYRYDLSSTQEKSVSTLTRRGPTSIPQEDDRIDVRLQLEDRTYKWFQGVVVAIRDQKVSKSVEPVVVFKVKFDPDSPNALALQTWVNLTSQVATLNSTPGLTVCAAGAWEHQQRLSNACVETYRVEREKKGEHMNTNAT